MATRPEPRTGQRRRRRTRDGPASLVLHAPQAVGAYLSVLTERLIRRLVAERCIVDRDAGRWVLLAEADLA